MGKNLMYKVMKSVEAHTSIICLFWSYRHCHSNRNILSPIRDAGKPGTLRNGTEWNGTEPEVIVVQYGRGSRTRGQKFALIRTAHFCVRTLISHSVTATKTGQAPTESYVKRINLLR